MKIGMTRSTKGFEIGWIRVSSLSAPMMNDQIGFRSANSTNRVPLQMRGAEASKKYLVLVLNKSRSFLLAVLFSIFSCAEFFFFGIASTYIFAALFSLKPTVATSATTQGSIRQPCTMAFNTLGVFFVPGFH